MALPEGSQDRSNSIGDLSGSMALGEVVRANLENDNFGVLMIKFVSLGNTPEQMGSLISGNAKVANAKVVNTKVANVSVRQS